MNLGIRQERLNKNWTQEYVAQKIGITKAAFRNIETAKRKPSYEVLVKLENLFNLTHRQLFAVADDANSISQHNNIISGD